MAVAFLRSRAIQVDPHELPPDHSISGDGSGVPRGPKVFFRVHFGDRALQFKLSNDSVLRNLFSKLDVVAEFSWHGTLLDPGLTPRDYGMKPGEENCVSLIVVRDAARDHTHRRDIELNDVARAHAYQRRLAEERANRCEAELDQAKAQIYALHSELRELTDSSAKALHDERVKNAELEQRVDSLQQMVEHLQLQQRIALGSVSGNGGGGAGHGAASPPRYMQPTRSSALGASGSSQPSSFTRQRQQQRAGGTSPKAAAAASPPLGRAGSFASDSAPRHRDPQPQQHQRPASSQRLQDELEAWQSSVLFGTPADRARGSSARDGATGAQHQRGAAAARHPGIATFDDDDDIDAPFGHPASRPRPLPVEDSRNDRPAPVNAEGRTASPASAAGARSTRDEADVRVNVTFVDEARQVERNLGHLVAPAAPASGGGVPLASVLHLISLPRDAGCRVEDCTLCLHSLASGRHEVVADEDVAATVVRDGDTIFLARLDG